MCVRCGRHAAGASRGPVVYTLEFIALARSGDSGWEQEKEKEGRGRWRWLGKGSRGEVGRERKSELSYESA